MSIESSVAVIVVEGLMKLKDKLDRILKNVAIEFHPGLNTVSFSLKDELSEKVLDARIHKISKIKNELTEAIQAVEQLESEAKERHLEVTNLRNAVSKLENDKFETEKIINVNEEVFSKVLSRASKKSNMVNLLMGFILGCLASIIATIVWEKVLKIYL